MSAADRKKGRAVSFGAEGDSDPPGPRPSVSQRRSSSLKSRSKLPIPKHLYQHPDPLLRRLRVFDSYGNAVNLQHEFRDTEIIGFLFGSDWARGKVADFYRDLSHFCMAHPHRFKCIYVSVDTTEEAYKANTKGRPWLALPWSDGSNLPVSDYQDATDPIVGSLANAEDFLLGDEQDMEASVVADDPEGAIYTRPYARIHLARHFEVLYVPTLAIYSLKTRTILSRRVKPDVMVRERQEATWQRWCRNENSDLTLSDLIIAVRWPLSILLAVLAYIIMTRVAGQEGSFQAIIGQLFDTRAKT